VALVLALGIDQQTVGALADRGGPDLSLADRVIAVDVLPGANVQPVTM
jgi:hypothetical protein